MELRLRGRWPCWFAKALEFHDTPESWPLALLALSSYGVPMDWLKDCIAMRLRCEISRQSYVIILGHHLYPLIMNLANNVDSSSAMQLSTLLNHFELEFNPHLSMKQSLCNHNDTILNSNQTVYSNHSGPLSSSNPPTNQSILNIHSPLMHHESSMIRYQYPPLTINQTLTTPASS